MTKADAIRFGSDDQVPVQWARSVYGSVLEVGLGLGRLTHALSKQIGRHIVLEQDPAVVERARANGLPPRVQVIVGTFPDDCPDERFDCITLDIPYSADIISAALERLKDGGALFIRKG